MHAPQKQTLSSANRHHVLRLLYVVAFVFVLSAALPAYVNSSFLGQFTSPQGVSALYVLGSLLTIAILSFIPRLLHRVGNYTTALLFVFTTILLLLGLAFVDSFFVIAPLFVLYLAFYSLIFFNLDIFLESYSTDAETGRIRGLYLTIINIAILLGPLLAGLIVGEADYWKMFVVSAVLMAILGALLLSNFRHFKDPAYGRVPFWSTLKTAWRDKNIFNIFLANLSLRFFFAWMVIYTPLYLHSFVGFSWGEIGALLAISLLPFVLFELPAGNLADKRFGEKEIMVLGFLIMGFATMGIVLIESAVFWIWAVVLFAARIGASFVEITTESYFFKHVDGTDANIIGFFRNNRPISYTLAPIIATIALFFVEFKFLFLILGLIMLLGVNIAFRIRDTR